MALERFIGIDLAWGHGGARARPNETGVAVIDARGEIVDCGWTRGVDETADRIASVAGTARRPSSSSTPRSWWTTPPGSGPASGRSADATDAGR
ncbi:hypothetical protein ACFV99_33220 [Streptomyces sp. NPDC059944]|uniref:hypothetical protein n=1 Tax=unclassified Streptomyces TaxID=2593676 RepID=UPI0036620A5F